MFKVRGFRVEGCPLTRKHLSPEGFSLGFRESTCATSHPYGPTGCSDAAIGHGGLVAPQGILGNIDTMPVLGFVRWDLF